MHQHTTSVKPYSFHAALVDWAFEGSNVHFGICTSFIAVIGLIAMAAVVGGAEP